VPRGQLSTFFGVFSMFTAMLLCGM
jgi:hypothetical protein